MTTPAPYFSLGRAAWVPRAVMWDQTTGEFQRLEEHDGCPDYTRAVEASQFLARQGPLDNSNS